MSSYLSRIGDRLLSGRPEVRILLATPYKDPKPFRAPGSFYFADKTARHCKRHLFRSFLYSPIIAERLDSENTSNLSLSYKHTYSYNTHSKILFDKKPFHFLKHINYRCFYPRKNFLYYIKTNIHLYYYQ